MEGYYAKVGLIFRLPAPARKLNFLLLHNLPAANQMARKTRGGGSPDDLYFFSAVVRLVVHSSGRLTPHPDKPRSDRHW